MEEVDEEDAEETDQAGKRKKGGVGGNRQSDIVPEPKKKPKRDPRKVRLAPTITQDSIR